MAGVNPNLHLTGEKTGIRLEKGAYVKKNFREEKRDTGGEYSDLTDGKRCRGPELGNCVKSARGGSKSGGKVQAFKSASLD